MRLGLEIERNLDARSTSHDTSTVVGFAASTAEWIEQRHLALLRPHLNSGVVCDVGCGPGTLVGLLASSGAHIVGLDGHRRSLLHARRAVPCAPFLEADVQRLPFQPGSLAAVTCSEVLEHVPEPRRLIAELHRALRPGGYATLSTPCGWIRWAHYTTLLTALVHPRRAIRLLFPERDWQSALQDHPALRPTVLRRWCIEAGFIVHQHVYSLLNEWTGTRLRYRLFTSLDAAGAPVYGFYRWLHEAAERRFAAGHWRVLASRQVLLLQKPHQLNP